MPVILGANKHRLHPRRYNIAFELFLWHSLMKIGLNAVVDFCLAAIVVADLWRVSSYVLRQHSGMSMCSRLRRLRNTVRFGQLWLILALSGPLVLSGAASIVKTCVSCTIPPGSD